MSAASNNPDIDADPDHAVRPTKRPSSVRVDRITMQEVTPEGVTPMRGVCFRIMTESGETVVFWPCDYAAAVAKLLLQQATGLLVAGDMPDASS